MLASVSENTADNLLASKNGDDTRTSKRTRASNHGMATAHQCEGRAPRARKESQQHCQQRGCQRSPSGMDRLSDTDDDNNSSQSRSRSCSPVSTNSQKTTCCHQTSRRRTQKSNHSASPGSRNHLSQSSSTSLDDSSLSPVPKKHTCCKHREGAKCKKKHHAHHRTPSTSSNESSTSTFSSSSQSSKEGRMHHHHCKHHHTCTRRRGHLPSRTKVKLKQLAVSCCPPLPDKYSIRIIRGEYVAFDKLTISEVHHKKHPSKHSKKAVLGLTSWLEA